MVDNSKAALAIVFGDVTKIPDSVPLQKIKFDYKGISDSFFNHGSSKGARRKEMVNERERGKSRLLSVVTLFELLKPFFSFEGHSLRNVTQVFFFKSLTFKILILNALALNKLRIFSQALAF